MIACPDAQRCAIGANSARPSGKTQIARLNSASSFRRTSKTGAIAKLIDRLENDNLDYRVLAWQNLLEITGMQLMPNPAAKLADRSIQVRKWRARLDVGDVKILQPAVPQ